MKTRILLVGRHDPPQEMLDEFEIIQHNVIFAIDKGRRKKQVVELFEMANSKHAHLVFQNIPGVLFPMLYNVIDDYMHIKVGVVVTEAMPEERERMLNEYTFDCPTCMDKAAELLRDFAPNVTIVENELCTMLVEGHGTMPFRYIRVEWL